MIGHRRCSVEHPAASAAPVTAARQNRHACRSCRSPPAAKCMTGRPFNDSKLPEDRDRRVTHEFLAGPDINALRMTPSRETVITTEVSGTAPWRIFV